MTDDPAERERISQALAAWANRDPGARERLVPIVYEELRRLAHRYMRHERAGHSLQTTALAGISSPPSTITPCRSSTRTTSTPVAISAPASSAA